MPRLAYASFVFLLALAVHAEETPSLSTKDLAARLRPSIVVITYAGRDGNQQGLGTGFVIDKSGLIATNLHVIGEARPISVQTADGKSLAVTAIHASDRALDLAILKVDKTDLPALEISDDKPVAGEPVVVMGNPQGLKHSVVTGVISGLREIDGRNMLQLAIPVEPGNSGGPVVDLQGRVLGIVTMKSAVTENLGFAVAASDLKSLREKPNPVPMDRWLTIGAIDRTQWEPLFGARWQQRAGRIVVDGLGAGFGGRSLLVSKIDPPQLPFDLAVTVKLDDETGAAGLIFHSDGNHKHYGFYPSNGRLRLTRFDGPDVFSWHVLAEKPSDHYRPGEWNRLKVRIDRGKLQCFVNDELVIESSDDGFTQGRVGLAKFRNTGAEFRLFAVASELSSAKPDAAELAKLNDQIKSLPPLAKLDDENVRELATDRPEDARNVLLNRATDLESQAAELKRLAADVNTAAICEKLARFAGTNVAKTDLLRAALTIARLDEEDLDIDAYVKHVDRMAEAINQKLAADSTESQKLAALNEYLFHDNGFHGSRTDYYHRANSHLNRVIDDREGLPITLSVLYIELGARIGLKIEGVGLPAHFVVRHVPTAGEPQLIDVFESAAPLSRSAAEKKIASITGDVPLPQHFDAVSDRQILERILLNLISNAQNPKTGPDREALLRYESAMLAIDPTLPRDRGLRAICRWETGRTAAAISDLQVLIDAKPPGLDIDELKKMQEYFRSAKPGR
ncbi:MAG TPA: transglutaminase family protein [Pirellulaceae bacterium]|jgi:regulator of sirC expression with transglutaminase-like and TPR domain